MTTSSTSEPPVLPCLEWVLATIALVMLACWAPHYRTWPLYADHDVFATAAQSWDAGVRPYRDFACNNLPGAIYLGWMVGKLGGWGNSSLFFLADAVLLTAWCCLVIAWSHRTLGSRLPGWVAVLAFLSYYLDLGYAMAAQRDWQATALALGGLLAAQTWPGRWGRRCSAIGAALALTFRPQAVVFLPVLMLQAAQVDGNWRRKFLSLAAWCLECAAALFLAYLPVIVQGLLPDLVRGLRMTAPGSSYARWSVGRIAGDLLRPVLTPQLVAVPLALLLLPKGGRDRLVGCWLLLTAAVLFYKPISPFPHAYLDIPLKLVWAVDCGLVAGLLLRLPLPLPGRAVSARLALIALLVGLSVLGRPRSCDPMASLRAIRSRSSDWPVDAPVGYRPIAGFPSAAAYPWDDYRQTLLWLRDHTRPETRIANVLFDVPALTGMLGRPTAFPAESIAWIKMVRRDDEPSFAQALEACEDAVVVWVPDETSPDPSFQIPHIDEVIRRKFEPNQRFGAIEIWTPRPAS